MTILLSSFLVLAASFACLSGGSLSLRPLFDLKTLEPVFKYGDTVIGFESLVELPRTGKIYEQDGWTEVGQTIGYTCKRTAGKGTDSWTGRRIWDTKNLRPKRVFCKLASLPIIQQAIHNHVATGTSTLHYQKMAEAIELMGGAHAAARPMLSKENMK